jgi:hypothetical protein
MQPILGYETELKSDFKLRSFGMRKLITYIEEELRTANHCAVYNEELARVWPDNGKRREAEIAQFAKIHGWRLRFYREGLCAIFDKPTGTEADSTSRNLPL